MPVAQKNNSISCARSTFGDKNAMLAAWADFAASPVVSTFRWSPLVELAFDNNREVVAPTTVSEPPLSALPYDTPNAVRYPAIPGLLVLHLRRGDYAGHCEHLAKWSSTFLAFNQLPGLEDFTPPPGSAPWGENTPENTALYRRRCLPTIPEVVARVREVQQAHTARGLENVYIMTNGALEWVEELKGALADMGGFKHIASSRDTVLNWEQKYVAQAMDMLVGQRAHVFIGNGWSSLTGGIVVMRHANGFHADTTRFF
uniref:H15 domain-containing protein n=1 Tax=Ganoderma boninense TaxID=34458 RepID=A0A5K1K3W2_9APHY|nr:H15 domain-containing protein [Ganoderma boninense]